MPALMNRRELLQLGAGSVALFMLAGCNNPGDKRVKFYNWQDYIDDNLIEDFQRSSGLTVTYSTYESNDELGDRLALAGVPRRGSRKATGFDLIVPSDSLFRRLRDQDRLQELDNTIVTEGLLGNLDPAFRKLDVDPGNRFSIPWATGSTGIGYSKKAFREPPTWDVFLDATYAGKMTLLDEKREAFAAAHFSLGTDPNATGSQEIDAAAAQLAKMLANAALDAGTYLKRLEGGELVAAQAFSTDVLQAQANNPDLAFVIPAAGGTRWVDLLCIPADAGNPKGANEFVAHYLDGKVAAQNALAIQANAANTAARAFMPKGLLDNEVVFPTADVEGRLVSLNDLGDGEELYNQAWEKIRS
jgi:spermidine/putrescine transport system substrate-binding protein